MTLVTKIMYTAIRSLVCWWKHIGIESILNIVACGVHKEICFYCRSFLLSFSWNIYNTRIVTMLLTLWRFFIFSNRLAAQQDPYFHNNKKNDNTIVYALLQVVSFRSALTSLHIHFMLSRQRWCYHGCIIFFVVFSWIFFSFFFSTCSQQKCMKQRSGCRKMV